MRTRWLIPVVCWLLVPGGPASGPAWANDTSSELAIGGLRFVRTDQIAIEREDLFLSPREVRVRYAMRNLTDHEVRLHVAFPLPAVPIEGPDGFRIFDEQGHDAGRSVLGFERYGQANFLDFRASMGGRYLAPQIEVRAALPDGRDITEALFDIGGYSLMLRPRLFSASRDLGFAGGDGEENVGPNILRQLDELGAIRKDPADELGMARWRTFVTFHWDAVFPPGVTVVEHRYTPIVGFSHVGFTRDVARAKERAAAIAGYCIGPTEVGRLDAAMAARTGPTASDDLDGITLGYVLSTGANWAGPIRHFHLEITTDPARFLPRFDTIELCTEFPLRRPAPGRVEADVDSFMPTKDIEVLLLDTK
jgi:hypothetical protein